MSPTSSHTADALYVGIDLGTSGCRVIAIDAAGEVRGAVRVAMPEPIRYGPGVEQSPMVWWLAVVDALRRLAQQIPVAALRALAIDGTSGTLLLADAAGQPLGPANMYNDSRARREAAAIRRCAPPTSAAHGSGGSLAKLLRLAARPGAAAARYALHQADWIAGRLTGRPGTSDINNCLKLGYDPVARCWPDWLASLGVAPGLLPRVVEPGTPLGPLSAEAARELNLPAHIQVVAGTTDSTAAFLATGAAKVGEAVTSLGSTLVLKVISAQPVFAPDFGVYSQPLPGTGATRWLAGGGSNSGGAVLRHYFSAEQIAALTALLEPAVPTGLDYYPLVGAGERFPANDPEFAPRLTPRPSEDRVFFQGMLEGIAAIERDGYQRLAQLGAPFPRSVRSVGQGAMNGAWTAIRERLLGVPMCPARHSEAAYGSALLARQGVLGIPASESGH